MRRKRKPCSDRHVPPEVVVPCPDPVRVNHRKESLQKSRGPKRIDARVRRDPSEPKGSTCLTKKGWCAAGPFSENQKSASKSCERTENERCGVRNVKIARTNEAGDIRGMTGRGRVNPIKGNLQGGQQTREVPAEGVKLQTPGGGVLE